MIHYLKTLIVDIKQAMFERERYHHHKLFAQVDQQLSMSYFLKNPYRVCSSYLKKRGDRDIHLYGETPLLALEKIAKQVQLSDQDVIVDLGAGRGRALAFWHCFYGARAVGYEQVPTFCERALALFNRYDLQIEMHNRLIEEGINQETTVLYLYGSNFSSPQIKKIVSDIKGLNRLKYVVSISFPLSDYSSGLFKPFKTLEVDFPWGQTTAYIEEVIPCESKSQNPVPFQSTDSSMTK